MGIRVGAGGSAWVVDGSANIRIYILPSLVNNILQLAIQIWTAYAKATLNQMRRELQFGVYCKRTKNTKQKERDGKTNEERYYFWCHCLVYAIVPEG